MSSARTARRAFSENTLTRRDFTTGLALLLGLGLGSGIVAGGAAAPARASEAATAAPAGSLTTDDTLYSDHEHVTQELVSMVNHNAELKAMLEKAIAQAAAINPDRVTNPAQTLEEFYDYIDWAAKALPWAITPGDIEYSSLFDAIDQSLDYFYFIIDQPLDELEDLGLYHNSLQYYEPLRSWLISFTAQYGAFLNTEDSWSDEYYELALADGTFHLDDGTYEDPSNWHTFNQFFARYLSSPDRRPIASPDDASVLISPADAVPQGIWQIDEDNSIVGAADAHDVSIKSSTFTSAAQLLGGGEYAEAFAGGTLTHTFLNVNDYHRFHFPVGGTIVAVELIPADDAIGGRIYWDAKLGRYMLDCENPGWQNIETRALVVVDTEEYGLVAIMPIGMSQISSVSFEDTVQVGALVEKGDMLGCFLFGGSDIVMLFQQGVTLNITVPRNVDETYQHIEMGEAYGTLSREG